MKCIDAFKNLNIEFKGTNLEISPCCISAKVKVDVIDFNHQHLVDIRNKWLTQQFPKECSVCQQAEQQNLESRRIGINRWYTDNDYNNLIPELVRLDYWTGDTCNLACVICGPDNSSQWKKELKFDLDNRHRIVNQYWRNIDLTKIRYVHFNGGEPLLSKDHIEFLKSFTNKDQVHINYNTNGTILPSAELLEIWSQFKLVQLDFSIDDIEARFEYQRYPAKWTEVKANLQWYIDNSPVNCMFAVNTTVSILNYANLSNLADWLKVNFHTNRVTDPIGHRQQLAFGLFSLNSAETRKTKIIEFLDNCDSRRGTNWRDVFPELAKFINT